MRQECASLTKAQLGKPTGQRNSVEQPKNVRTRGTTIPQQPIDSRIVFTASHDAISAQVRESRLPLHPPQVDLSAINLSLKARFDDGKCNLLSIQIGGLRGDPLNMFPIPNRGHVAAAFDYFTEVYASIAIRADLLRTYMQTLLHDPMYFEQTIAFSAAKEFQQRETGGLMPRAVMHHFNNAIAHLRTRLSSSEATSDIVILTILQQAGIQHMFGNHKPFGIHVQAVQKIVMLRGGLEHLGWDGYIASRVQHALAAWDNIQPMQGKSASGITQVQ
jgi:hypothetical protein